MSTAATAQTEMDATNVACLNRVKGFLGTAEEMTTIAETVAPHSIEWVKSLSDAELLPLGEKALGDIADDILILDEIRQRFHTKQHILGYCSWREFVEKNSRYSVRSIQRKLAEKNGKDETKINHRFESACPDCSETFPSKTQLKKHQHHAHKGPQPVTPVTPEPLAPFQVMPVFYECSVCHETVEVADARKHNEYRNHGVWQLPVHPPAIQGWSSMLAGEKLEAGRDAGCVYCDSHSSARSCPAHGWEEKRSFESRTLPVTPETSLADDFTEGIVDVSDVAAYEPEWVNKWRAENDKNAAYVKELEAGMDAEVGVLMSMPKPEQKYARSSGFNGSIYQDEKSRVAALSKGRFKVEGFKQDTDTNKFRDFVVTYTQTFHSEEEAVEMVNRLASVVKG